MIFRIFGINDFRILFGLGISFEIEFLVFEISILVFEISILVF